MAIRCQLMAAILGRQPLRVFQDWALGHATQALIARRHPADDLQISGACKNHSTGDCNLGGIIVWLGGCRHLLVTAKFLMEIGSHDCWVPKLGLQDSKEPPGLLSGAESWREKSLFFLRAVPGDLEMAGGAKYELAHQAIVLPSEMDVQNRLSARTCEHFLQF